MDDEKETVKKEEVVTTEEKPKTVKDGVSDGYSRFLIFVLLGLLRERR